MNPRPTPDHPVPSVSDAEAEQLLDRLAHSAPITPPQMDQLEEWTQWQEFDR